MHSEVSRLTPHHPQRSPFLVGISGASCSGKSSLAACIHQQLPQISDVLELDGYYHSLERVLNIEHGHDNPQSLDLARACDDIRQLKSGRVIDLPVYDFEHHRVGSFRQCFPRPLILIEGLFAFAYPPLCAEFDLKLWIDSNEAIRKQRRMSRDTAKRERTPEEIQLRYARDVVPGYQKFIKPLSGFADIRIINDGQDHNLSVAAEYVITRLKMSLETEISSSPNSPAPVLQQDKKESLGNEK